jgi:hypothetical protein
MRNRHPVSGIATGTPELTNTNGSAHGHLSKGKRRRAENCPEVGCEDVALRHYRSAPLYEVGEDPANGRH